MNVRANIDVLSYQSDFIRSRDKFLCIVAGYASGKSDACVYRALSLLQWRNKRGENPTIVIVAPSYRILEDSNMPDFMRVLDTFKLDYTISKQAKKIIFKKGVFKGEVWFRSSDNPDYIVGFDATDAILDEYDIQSIDKQRTTWSKINSRLRASKNSTLVIATTPEGFRHTYELFEERKIGKVLRARTYQNTFLPEDYIWDNIFRQYGKQVPEEKPKGISWDDLYVKYSSPLLQQYCGGEFVNVNGLSAYYGFARHINIYDYDIKPSVDEEILIGCDFNVDPLSAVFAVKRNEKLYIFDEVMLGAANTMLFIDHIKTKFPKHRKIVVYPDMTGIRKMTSGIGFSDVQLIQKAGFIVRGQNNYTQRDSLNSVNKAFMDRNVFVNINCRYLINDYEKVVTDEYGRIDKSDDRLTHVSDASRYLIDREYKINGHSKDYNTYGDKNV